MKLPCNALFIETCEPPYFSASVRRCVVVELVPESKRALIAVSTAIRSERYATPQWVNFDQLATTHERAAKMSADAVAVAIAGWIPPPSP